ncbi:hypothetical protein KIF59_20400 [Enterobacter cloacae subsp. cloacae]|nr:hypothetical protein [Enterobacter cloacae subsp. cloacae]
MSVSATRFFLPKSVIYGDIAALITMRIAKHDNQNRVTGSGIPDAGWLYGTVAAYGD